MILFVLLYYTNRVHCCELLLLFSSPSSENCPRNFSPPSRLITVFSYFFACAMNALLLLYSRECTGTCALMVAAAKATTREYEPVFYVLLHNGPWSQLTIYMYNNNGSCNSTNTHNYIYNIIIILVRFTERYYNL